MNLKDVSLFMSHVLLTYESRQFLFKYQPCKVHLTSGI